MIVTVFRSRLRKESEKDYQVRAKRMSELASSMPGYVSHKSFTADDGERVTLVEFENADAQRNWAIHPEHMQAQDSGRNSFYSQYKLQVCEIIRESEFSHSDG